MRAKCVLPFDFSGDIKLKMDDGVSCSICGHWSQISYFSLHEVSLFTYSAPPSQKNAAFSTRLSNWRVVGSERRRGGELCMPSPLAYRVT